tara:strand:+ start:110 stop:442 length:333 start_codon:yes stop_codon:yes gene_type:complete
MADNQEVTEELLEARRRIVELEASSKTVLTGTQFLTIILVGPLFLAFVTLGVLIVWKVTSKPAEVAPHLDVILLALSIFSLPVTSAAGSIVSLMSDEIKSRLGERSVNSK